MSAAPTPRLARPRPGSDGLRLRRAMSERMLPSLVAAMSFLAALALAGAIGAQLLAARWTTGAGVLLTVQVPEPSDPAASGPSPGVAMTRIDAVIARLALSRSFASIHRLDASELRQLLQPWLGAAAPDGDDLPLPAVVQLRLAASRALPSALARALQDAAPGTTLEDSAAWTDRLFALTTSLQACALLALLMVAVVAGCVVALATRGGIAMRRHAIEILHGLGASDGYIAGRFAGRAGRLALVGGAIGALLALPLLGGLSHLAAPFAAPPRIPEDPAALAAADPGVLGFDLAMLLPDQLPLVLLVALPTLPIAAGLIGWLTAQGTVRVWLRRLP